MEWNTHRNLPLWVIQIERFFGEGRTIKRMSCLGLSLAEVLRLSEAQSRSPIFRMRTLVLMRMKKQEKGRLLNQKRTHKIKPTTDSSSYSTLLVLEVYVQNVLN